MPDQTDERADARQDCPLCAEFESTPHVLARTPHAVAFIPPWSRGVPSVAVVPRVHAQSFEKMGFDEFESTFEAAVEIMPSLRKAFDPEGMNFWWDEGAAAGQVLPHTFIELACRFQDSDYRYRPLDELPLRPDGEREAIHKRVLDEMGRDGV